MIFNFILLALILGSAISSVNAVDHGHRLILCDPKPGCKRACYAYWEFNYYPNFRKTDKTQMSTEPLGGLSYGYAYDPNGNTVTWTRNSGGDGYWTQQKGNGPISSRHSCGNDHYTVILDDRDRKCYSVMACFE